MTPASLCQQGEHDGFEARARYLVESNRERYPDLLVEQMATAMRESAGATSRCVFAEEMVVVALRMLKRAGNLKPTTDDERVAVRLCSYLIDVPAANRRLLHPDQPEYVDAVVALAQETLFDTNSQGSVSSEDVCPTHGPLPPGLQACDRCERSPAPAEDAA